MAQRERVRQRERMGGGGGGGLNLLADLENVLLSKQKVGLDRRRKVCSFLPSPSLISPPSPAPPPFPPHPPHPIYKKMV